MNLTFYKIFFTTYCLLFTGINLLFAQQAAEPDLKEALILCNTRDFTIDQFVGAGDDTSEASDGCLNGITEANTAWFSWGGGNTEGNITFTITPNNSNDRFGFTIFELPNLNDGTGKSAIGCVLPCRTGEIGLRIGDGDFNIDNCANATDGFIDAIIVETGFFYGLMIENTTSNEGFTISFGGNASFIGPTGEIMANAPNACFGTPLTFDDNIAIKDGMISSYTWAVENEIGQIEETRTSQVPTSQTFDFQSIGTKNITLSVVSSLDVVANQTCTAKFELEVPINACCETDNKVEIIDTTFSEIKCPDDTNGAIDIEVNPGNPMFPPRYEWSNNATTQDIMNLSPATYSVTVSNDAGCRDSISHTFIIPNALTAVETITAPSCGGATDGAIAITASGGRMPYTYNYGDGNGFVLNATLNGLDTGDYEVVVMDDSGCTTTISAIELDDKELTITFDTVAISCFSANDGQVIIPNPPNGTGPFQYDFNDGNGLVNATALQNLGPGNYTIDVFDAEGCTGNPIDVQLRQPEALIVSITEARKFCNGEDDGYVTSTVSGGEGMIGFEWNNGTISNVVNDLLAGEYSVTVTDENGCTSSDTIQLNDQPLLVATIDNITDVSCSSENDGQIVLDITGGVMPYQYSLDGINFQSGTTISNLGPGDYDIIVQDNFSCQTTLNTVTISSPETLSFDVSSSTDICYGESLTFTNTATFTRGNPDLITWNINGTTYTGNSPTVSFTEIGNPRVTLTIQTDLGCTAFITDTLNIAVTPCCETDNGLNFSPSVETPFCANSADGSITLNASSIPPITNITWSNNENTDIIENLAAGEYTVTVTNDATCDTMLTFSINEPNPIIATLSIIEPTCNEAANGAISVTASGGTVTTNADYQFDFGNGYSTNNTFSNLMAGPHSIMVRDGNNCEIPVDTMLAVPAGFEAIAATFDLTMPSCDAAANGAIAVTATGNGGNFQYDFGNGFSNQNNATDLSIGNFTITIQDGDNCTLTKDTSLAALVGFEAINAVLNITQPTCDAAANGIIIVAATGNGGNFQYDFGNGFSTQSDTTGLIIGNYSVTIQDGDNCTLTKDTMLAVPDGFEAINAVLNINQPTCDAAANGAITVTATGNGGNFQYDFGNGFSTQSDTTGLIIGNYSVTIQDGDNCTLTKDTMLAVPDGFEAINAVLNINQPTCDAAANGAITVNAIGDGGNFQYDFGNGFSNQNNATDLSIGNFTITIQDGDNCTLTKDTMLAVPDGFEAIAAILNITQPSCDEGTNGAISVNASGNGGNFQYDFGNGFSTQSDTTGLIIGNYSVTIQDGDNCTITKDTILVAPTNATPVLATLQISQPSCGGGMDGSITVIPLASSELGTDINNYEYDFGNGNLNSNVANNLAEGSHLVVIRDANNCSLTLDTTLSELVLEATSLVTRPTCYGLSDGSIRFNVPNGNGPFLYDFGGDNFQDETALTNLADGIYSIRIRDADLCLSDTLSIIIDQPDSLTLSLNGTDISCFGAIDGRIVADVMGGVGNFSYSWNNGQTSNIAGMLSQGDYSVVVQDGNGCSKTSTMVMIAEPAQLFANIAQVDNVLCFGETNGTITIDANGGTGPYEYSLDGIIFQQSATLTNLAAGDYTITVKDSRNCEVPTENATVAEPVEFIITASVDNEVTKLGFPINLSAEANIPSRAINYIWNTPDSTVCSNCQSFEIVPPGSTTFTVIALNADNCQATDQVSVAVSLDRPVFIPNIFSPNGDGINDEFYIPFSPSMTGIKELRIFDRTGNMVFEAFDIKEGEELNKSWDGAFNGQKIRQGVFVITAQISFVDNQTLPYHSDLTLITSE